MTLQDELKNSALTRDKFFTLYTEALRVRYPTAAIEFSPPDKFEIGLQGGRTTTVYLENLWVVCRNGGADERIEAIEKHFKMLDDSVRGEAKPSIDKEAIVPTIKDATFLSLFGNTANVVREHLAGDLWIVYGVDSAHAIRTLTASDITKLGLGNDELRSLSLSNLVRLLPDIERHGEGPSYMLSAGGDYVASILLLDKVWQQMEEIVVGDIVAAVPSRDVLLFTGSGSKEGIEWVRQKTREIHQGGDHVISETLLRWKAGKWAVFD